MKAMTEISRRRKFLAVGKACMAVSDLLQAIKVEHLSALGSQQRGP